MRQELSDVEQQALNDAFQDDTFRAALKKFFQMKEDSHTRTVREQQNLIPASVDAKVHKEALQAVNGGMAEAYRVAYAELEKVARG